MVSRGKVNEPFSTKPFSSEHLDEINSTGSSADRLSAASSSPRLLRYFFSLSLPLTEETLFSSDQSRIRRVKLSYERIFIISLLLLERSFETNKMRARNEKADSKNRGDGGGGEIDKIYFHPWRKGERNKKNCLRFGRPIKDNRAWKNTRGGEGGGADNGSARSDKKRRAALK